MKNIEGVINRRMMKVTKTVSDELGTFPTSIISDCLQRFGTMDSRIKPLVKGRKFSGPALTVEEIEGGNLMSHCALEIIEKGDVLVIDGKGCLTRASLGGVQAYVCKKKEVAAIVVFGAVRDLEDIEKLGLPVYAMAVSPAGPHKGFGGNVNTTIACGGVPVSPGDVVIGDDDGVVVVPSDKAEKVLELARSKKRTEEDWYKRIDQGQTTREILGLDKNIKEFGIEKKQ